MTPPDVRPSRPQIDREWVAAAKRRLAEIRSGAARPAPGSEVFRSIRDRYAK